MRPPFIVVQAPLADLLPGVSDILEPMLTQIFIPEFTIEALNVPVLHRLSGLYQFQLNAMAVSPLIECSASEFCPLVGSYRFRVAIISRFLTGVINRGLRKCLAIQGKPIRNCLCGTERTAERRRYNVRKKMDMHNGLTPKLGHSQASK